jgi:hypothetical protein
MSRLLQATILTAAIAAAVVGGPSASAASVQVASSRCNGQTIDDAAARVRDYDRRGTGGNSTQLIQRYGSIAEVIAVLNEEREILNSLCTSDAQRAGFLAQIAAISAWALVLESGVTAKLNASCPAAETALPTMMLADAWLTMANIVNEQNGTVPPAFNDMIPRVQSRAQSVGLTLPPWSETSAYWSDQIHAKAKAAIATCPSPSPSPTTMP